MSGRLQNLFRGGHRKERPVEDLNSIDLYDVRTNSLRRGERLGYPIDPRLPELRRPEHIRRPEDFLSRLLCLSALTQASNGLPPAKALDWLQRENAADLLTGSERRQLDQNEVGSDSIRCESIWTLIWALGLSRSFSFAEPADQPLSSAFLPKIDENESTEVLRRRIRPRSASALYRQLDLARCLELAMAKVAQSGRVLPNQIDPSILSARREMLEWIFSE